MTIFDLAGAFGALLSGGLAGLAAWMKFFKKSDQRESQIPVKPEFSRAHLAALRDRMQRLEEWQQRIDAQQRDTELRLGETVSDEDFKATSRGFNENVRQLTEKIGELSGEVRTWYRERR